MTNECVKTISLKCDYSDMGGRIVLTNSNGDTFETTSESFNDFLHDELKHPTQTQIDGEIFVEEGITVNMPKFLEEQRLKRNSKN
jgi:hypothetical protein